LKVLCVTDDPDRATVATFIGLKRSGVDIAVNCPPYEAQRAALAAAGIRVLGIALGRGINAEANGELRRELIAGKYDILHVFGNRALQHGLRATRGLPIRIVAYRGIVGNVSFFSPVSWMRYLHPRVDRIICVADAVRDFFLRMRPAFLRIPQHKVVRIYKGHSLDWYTAAPADLSALGIPPEAFVVSCVANYRPRKGIEFLVEAMAELPTDWPVHLLLVGVMNSRKLDRSIASSPAADRIHRLGRRDDAPSLTAASDVFVLPSVKREGLARSLIEAMAYGIPAVVTDCGGSPELVVDGETGLVVPVRDPHALARAIERLYQDPGLRQRFGAAARERIRDHFRNEDTIAQTLALYHDLVD
jgi:glycosyltransferase involved in cell wall biosynthesis